MKRRMYMFVSFMMIGLVALACGGDGEPPADNAPAPQEGAAVVQPQGQACKVPDIVGLPEASADSMLRGVGLQPLKSVQHDPTIANGAIISQDPPANTRLEPCQGDVEIVVSLGAPPEQSAASEPAEAPQVESTPAPDLFWDDFETGIKPEWGMQGSGFFVVNGKLTLDDGSFESKVIGDNSWRNYKIRLYGFDHHHGSTPKIWVRVQNRDNYMLFHCKDYDRCNWYRVIDGEKQEIPETRVKLKRGDFSFEIQDNVYRTIIQGEQKIRFVDDTFDSGGFIMQHGEGGDFQLEGIEVTTLQ
ncbi:PASTA domain-containing protein [Anaerolineales bacterium HSG24]|nr:PASTA domain-containing protein [Anaerolineales bacterium HSG24]